MSDTPLTDVPHALVDGQILDPKDCPKSDNGHCTKCKVECFTHYGFAGGYGLGVSLMCPNCSTTYDFHPDNEE